MAFIQLAKLNDILCYLTDLREHQDKPIIEFYADIRRFLRQYDALNPDELKEFWGYLEAIKP